MVPSQPPAVSKISLIHPDVCPSPRLPQTPLGHPLPSASSHCIPRNDSDALQNAILPELLRLPEPELRKWVFIMKWTIKILLFLICLNLKVTNAWKLSCNCIWVSQFHSFCSRGRMDANFFVKTNNNFQDNKDSTCKIQTIPVVGKDVPSWWLSSASLWVLHVHSPQK